MGNGEVAVPIADPEMTVIMTPGTHYVSTGIEEAVKVASDLAGEKVVGLNAGTIATQAYAAGLLHEVWGDLVPVVLGEERPFFGDLGGPVVLDGPLEVTAGTDVTHLGYAVRRWACVRSGPCRRSTSSAAAMRGGSRSGHSC
jgi:hypothetical protein